MDMIKSYAEIKYTPEDKRTEDEKIRFLRGSMIPDIVRKILEEKAEDLRGKIMELEKERDTIIDFLNGFWAAKNVYWEVQGE